MTLVKYNQKRNFKSTAEPAGKKQSSQSNLIFAVQKHAASHLHYDFRLEMEGVLKSWAVPKGPSMNPEDKRLAMMVEDHPYGYKDFEGNIAKGNYGAGNVIVWDRGTYEALDTTGGKKESEKKLLSELRKGHISIMLHGKKLKGGFSLVRLNGKQENAWLLIKKNDKEASTLDILKKNKSVISKVTLEQLEKKYQKEKIPLKKRPIAVERNSEIPEVKKIEPMLAHIADSTFDRKGWIFEIKYDGYRVLALIDKNHQVELFSRNHLSFNKKFKSIADELAKLDHPAVLDGEVVIEDSKGRSHFQLLQNYQKSGEGVLKYYVFDILSLDGKDSRNLPLLQRKELVKMLLEKKKLNNIFYSEHIEENGKAFFEIAIKNNLEGIMAKDGNSLYRSGRRSDEWLKIKISQQEEAIVAGITSPKGNRNFFGSVLLAQYNKNELKYIGNCGTGFNEAALKDLYNKIKPYFTNTSPFKETIKLNGTIQWIKPKFVCQVKFTEWTHDHHLRHPVFLGLRIDKTAKEVVNHSTIENMKTGKDIDLKIGKITLHLTNQDKIYFPDDSITKGDLVNYYTEIADVMLPYLKDRPQSMNRFPNGINNAGFYQKDVDAKKIPAWLKTHKVYSESNDENINYLICNDKATLIYMANLGCIEINPWNSTVKHLNNPDWMVIDLDPEKIEFKEVVKTARIVKQVMDELNTECYCKTSGATGLHIFIPLAARYNYDTVRRFGQLIAYTVNVRLPEITSTERLPKKRQHKVYIDFLQNSRGQTLAAPYSARPRPGATVSTPLEWKEVNEKLDPTVFTIKTILKRIEKKGDLWKPVIGKGADLNRILKVMEIPAEQNAI